MLTRAQLLCLSAAQQSLAQLVQWTKALHRAAGTDPTPYGYRGEGHDPGQSEASNIYIILDNIIYS